MGDDHEDRGAGEGAGSGEGAGATVTAPAGRSIVDVIERTRLAVPMALVTAAAAAFLAFAIPAAIVVRGLGATGYPPLTAAVTPFGAGARAVLMLVAALVAGGAVWWLFHRLDHPSQPAAEPEVDLFGPEPTVVPAEAAAPQLRRADSHPDAPARRPLFAASDLGAPMDDVDAGQLPFGRPPLFGATAADRDEPEILLLDETYRSVDIAPEREPMVAMRETGGVRPDPATGKETIAELMARLERGLERRGDMTGDTQPAVPDGHLRHALEELRRMTIGR